MKLSCKHLKDSWRLITFKVVDKDLLLMSALTLNINLKMVLHLQNITTALKFLQGSQMIHQTFSNEQVHIFISDLVFIVEIITLKVKKLF